MEKLFYSDEYVIHMDTSDNWLRFSLYPVWVWGDTEKEEYSYTSHSSSDNVYVFNEEDVRTMFDGMYCWRGVWEGRIEFKDDEFWGEELQTMSDIYNDFIVPWCKTFIMKREPNYTYDK